MSEINRVKIGGFYWMKERFHAHRTGQIIKISKLGNVLPQEIEGELFNTKTGELSVTEGLSYFGKSGQCVFACEIQDEASEQELAQIKIGVLDKITKFFTPASVKV